MESQPRNSEFSNNPENFYPCIFKIKVCSVVLNICAAI